MKYALLLASVALLLSGCMSTPLPQGYSGPTALIKDSVASESDSKANFFYVSKVDDRTIENSSGKTRQVNRGRGFYMDPQIVERPIPATKIELTLVGTTVHAADILALVKKNYSVDGKVSFEPKSGGKYVVRGVLGPSECSVWIEDVETGQVVSPKITNQK